MSSRILIVGGTAGIGRALALHYAAKQPTSLITVIGRNAQAAAELSAVSPNIHFLKGDASLMSDIKRCVHTYKQDNDRLDTLILTQGVLSMSGRNETTEGIDNKMALHYYGRMLFIRDLLPIIKDGGHVLTVLDAKHGHPKRVNWDDMDLKTSFSLTAAAMHCTTFNDIMVQHLSRHYPNIHFTHALPGFVNTSLARDMPWALKWMFSGLAKVAATSPEACANYMAKGMEETQGWSCVDEKGNKIKKDEADEATQQRLVEHTWAIIDKAAASGSDSSSASSSTQPSSSS
eukprot:TRINITY_DN11084_c0_g1_i1.p1 TRINITY_DN11084_c0_g1~~TRINITY_DN11084_c0_g1_i1.p1  ORF type:complete len:311 (+),score=81.26 TRINITY_DN11084_c0_g1_i1:69-935(+)